MSSPSRASQFVSSINLQALVKSACAYFHIALLLLVVGLFLLFTLPVALGNGAVLVGAGKGIEYTDVEVCPLPVSSPKVLYDDVKAGPVFTVRRSVEELFVCHWLQVWLSSHSMANFC